MKRKIATLTLSIFLVTQVFVVSTGLLLPTKKAEAIFGIGDTTIIIGNVWEALRDIAIGAMRQLAHSVVEKFISQFTSKLVEKYKIRNFLYYDMVLKDYYLTNFIRDHVDDPDLEQIFVMLNNAYITGQPTGANSPPISPRQALIPRLKRAITDLYIEQTGIDPNTIASKPAGMSNKDYLSLAQSYYFNSPGYTEANLRGRVGEFQAASTTAAQLEVLVGNGLKAGRFVGGTCSINTANSPSACETAGGTWNESAADRARSFIDSPTRFIDAHLDAAILKRFDNNFDANNYWAVIGSLVGNMLFKNLFLDNNRGTLNEDPNAYVPASANAGTDPANGRDTDFDGVIDGYDYNGDGALDICNYGGSAPNCIGSRTATTPPPPPPSACLSGSTPVVVTDPVTGQQTTQQGSTQLCV